MALYVKGRDRDGYARTGRVGLAATVRGRRWLTRPALDVASVAQAASSPGPRVSAWTWCAPLMPRPVTQDARAVASVGAHAVGSTMYATRATRPVPRAS